MQNDITNKEPIDMRHFRNERGMSLMELMIVVVVVGITASMAAPSFFEALPKLQAKSQIHDIVTMMRKARSLAVATKQPHGVSFDYNDNSYAVFKEDSTGDTKISSSPVGNDVIMAYDTFGGSEVVFQPDGSASETGYVCMATEDYRSYYWLSILAATGRVKVEDSWESHTE